MGKLAAKIKMAGFLSKHLKSQDFRPTLLGLFTNPFYFARKEAYENIKKFAPRLDGRLLDVGCGTQPYKDLFNVKEYIGLEIDTPSNRKLKEVDIFYEGKSFPFADGEFDSILMTEVLQYIPKQDQLFVELRRVLKPGGKILLTTPLVCGEVAHLNDLIRYTSFGLRQLLNNHEFDVLETRKSVIGIQLLSATINNYTWENILPRNKYLKLLCTLILIAPVNILGKVLSGIMPARDKLYLGNVILAEKRV